MLGYVTVFLLVALFSRVDTFSVDPKRMAGIWRFSSNILPYQRPTIQRQEPLNETLLRLSQDGSFRECREGYVEGCWMTGRWHLWNETSTRQRLSLALDRQYFGPRHDTYMTGELVKNEVKVSVRVGQVYQGIFRNPKNLPAFFHDKPILEDSREVGYFTMSQSLSTFSLQQVPPDEDLQKEGVFD